MNPRVKDVFRGKVVNKARTLNTGVDEFPRYVLECLIDNYCSEETFQQDMEKVVRRLKETFVHGAEAEWLDLLINSCGLDPAEMSRREQLVYLCRCIPLVETNYNLIELEARGAGDDQPAAQGVEQPIGAGVERQPGLVGGGQPRCERTSLASAAAAIAAGQPA